MKLAALFVVGLLAGTASAQPYPANPYSAGGPPVAAQPYAGPPPGAVVGVGVEPVPPRAAFRQMMLERFDRNHDGRLDRRERRHAAKALRKMAKRMARGERRGRMPRG
jgi:hypothetical protein